MLAAGSHHSSVPFVHSSRVPARPVLLLQYHRKPSTTTTPRCNVMPFPSNMILHFPIPTAWSAKWSTSNRKFFSEKRSNPPRLSHSFFLMRLFERCETVSYLLCSVIYARWLLLVSWKSWSATLRRPGSSPWIIKPTRWLKKMHPRRRAFLWCLCVVNWIVAA